MRKLLSSLQFTLKFLSSQLNLSNQKVCKLLKFCRMPAQCIPFKVVSRHHSKKYDECMYNNECKYHQVSFHLNTMTAHYTCTLFKLLYRRYKLTVIACRGLKRSLWPGWVRSQPFTCSSLFKAISPTLDFCNSKAAARSMLIL